MFSPIDAQEVWRESFSVPEKGIWGDENGTIVSDLSGITSWTLEYSSLELLNPDDYVKTVTTSGGRFEARDINGEVTWRSEWIDIEGFDNVIVELISAETGSGANTGTKYMKVFYRLDNDIEVPFSENSTNAGNWGSLKARQEGIKGNLLQVVCKISTHYAADKVILDEVLVWNEPKSAPPVSPYDVVINELMTDPYPPESLPDVEYIELYNTCDFAVNTENWQLSIDGAAKKLQQNFIPAGGYLLLCATGALDSLKSYGAVSNVLGFQGLLNKGATIEIIDGEGDVIDRVAYSDSWFGDEVKKNGGWSLERIDPQRNCNQSANWLASIHPDGGTPGEKNSIVAENKDEILPFVRCAVAVSQNQVEILVSEPVDTTTFMNSSNYFIHEIGNPGNIDQLSKEKVVLHFSANFQKSRVYDLDITSLLDECNNVMVNSKHEIQWNSIEPGDVLINEILFDPFPGGEDFAEIYNCSNKLVDLSRLFIARRTKEGEPDQVYNMIWERRILYPGEYLALTKDTNAVFPWFTIQCPACFLQINPFPAFLNEQGCVIVLNEDMKIVDEFCYHENMHAPFLADTEGVSLERVSVSKSANAYGNWHSAAKDAGYGTPGAKNSQQGNDSAGKPGIVFEPEAFSPNYDGYNDEYKIHYQFGKPGFIANIKIFDAGGRFIRHLLQNESLGTTGTITWNGEDETGQLLSVGAYVVMLEVFNADGEFYRFKDGVILTGLMK